MNKNISTQLAILIILSVIIAIISVVFLFCPETKKILFQGESNGTELDIVSTTTRTETDYDESTSTEDWQTYKNEQYGFEVKYPPSLQVSEEYAEAATNITFEGKEGFHYNIQILSKWSDDIYKITEDYFPTREVSVDDVELNDYQAFLVSSKNPPADYYILLHGNFIYVFLAGTTEIYKLNNLINSTFRFIEPAEKCVDNCGNGICEEVVCLAIGCSCAETKETCPRDCKMKSEPENLKLEIKGFTTDKKIYSSNEELKASLIILSSKEVKEVIIKLTGIKPYTHAYINDSQTIDLNSGENEIVFTEKTPYCTSGCGGVYPGPYDLDIEIFIKENLVASSTISIDLTDN